MSMCKPNEHDFADMTEVLRKMGLPDTPRNPIYADVDMSACSVKGCNAMRYILDAESEQARVLLGSPFINYFR